MVYSICGIHTYVPTYVRTYGPRRAMPLRQSSAVPRAMCVWGVWCRLCVLC